MLDTGVRGLVYQDRLDPSVHTHTIKVQIGAFAYLVMLGRQWKSM